MKVIPCMKPGADVINKFPLLPNYAEVMHFDSLEIVT